MWAVVCFDILCFCFCLGLNVQWFEQAIITSCVQTSKKHPDLWTGGGLSIQHHFLCVNVKIATCIIIIIIKTFNKKTHQNDQKTEQNDNENDQNNNQNDGNNNENDQNSYQNDGQDENLNQNDGKGNNRQRKKKRFLEDRGGQACGNKASSCGQWWGGIQACMGSNVAYSLYGILPADSASTFKPCNRATFINSFFTKDGLTKFVQASNGAVDISDLNQQCANYGNGLGVSTGCSVRGMFTIDTFNGGCYGKNYAATVDKLEILNKALENDMKCMLIYSSDGSTNYANDLLSQSQQCSFDLDKCPNPYGLVGKFEVNFAMAQRITKYKVPDASMGNAVYMALAVAFTFASAAILVWYFRPTVVSAQSEWLDFVPNYYVVYA